MTSEELKRLQDQNAQAWLGPTVVTTGLAPELAEQVSQMRGDKPKTSWSDFSTKDTTDEKWKAMASQVTDADYEELARRDPTFRKKWNDAKMNQVSLDFARSEKRYVSNARNFSTIIRFMGHKFLDVPNLRSEDGVQLLFEHGHWTLENLNETFHILCAKGVLEVPVGEPKKLTEAEKLAVVSLVRGGDPRAAITRFLELSLGKLPSRIDPHEFIAAHPELTRSAVRFVWDAIHEGELSDTEVREFKEYASEIRIPTADTLDRAFARWQDAQHSPIRTTQQAPAQLEPEARDPNHLTDEELAAAIAEARRNYRRALPL